jgi:uncharacterized protein YcsI (UPF0317 family)
LGWVQANLVILPARNALSFVTFCWRNARACPLLDITEPGNPHPVLAAPDADLRTDLPLYNIYRESELVDQVSSIEALWREDLVAFLLGCSFTFDQALVNAGIHPRHLEKGSNVSMYHTNLLCLRAGHFAGRLVVSMRPIRRGQIEKAREISSAFSGAHGSPLAVQDPAELGVSDLQCPDFGDRVDILDEEVPLFWPCGVTASVAAVSAGDFVITHAPGHMFITDWPFDAFCGSRFFPMLRDEEPSK